MKQELYDAQILSLSEGRAPTLPPESTIEENAFNTVEDDPILEPIFPNEPFGCENVENINWHHDLTFEDFFECFAGMDSSRIHVDSTSGPTPEMSFLEQEASTKLYDGAEMSRLELIFWILTMQSRHSLSNVCVDDMLSGIADKIISKKLHPNMPHTRVEARKVLTDLGLDYVVYDACPCDQTLYYGRNKDKLACAKCKLSRYGTTTKKKIVPRKVSV